MKSIVFFNNKGGVGKTTLICNVAANFAMRFKKKVLLIDCDPQCNSTQLVLDDVLCAELYWNKTPSLRHTLLDVLKPIEVGDASINPIFTAVPSETNRFTVIPHERLNSSRCCQGLWWWMWPGSTFSTAQPFSSLWNVTRSIRPERLSTGRDRGSVRNSDVVVAPSLDGKVSPLCRGRYTKIGIVSRRPGCGATRITLAIPAKHARFSLILGRLLPHDMGIVT